MIVRDASIDRLPPIKIKCSVRGRLGGSLVGPRNRRGVPQVVQKELPTGDVEVSGSPAETRLVFAISSGYSTEQTI